MKSLLRTRRQLGWLSPILRLTVGACLLPGSLGDYGHDHHGGYHCEKVCLLCSEIPDFSGCDNCSCGSGPKPEWDGNSKDVTIWMVLMIGVMIFILFCRLCSCSQSCSSWQEGRVPQTHRIVAQPVGTAYQHHQRSYVIPSRRTHVNVSVTPTNSHLSHSHPNPAPSRYTIPGPFIIPLGEPQPPNNDLDLPPPEYFPPPSYNECVGGVRRDPRTKY